MTAILAPSSVLNGAQTRMDAGFATAWVDALSHVLGTVARPRYTVRRIDPPGEVDRRAGVGEEKGIPLLPPSPTPQ